MSGQQLSAIAIHNLALPFQTSPLGPFCWLKFSDTLLQIVDGVADAKIKNQRVAPRVIHAAGLDAPIVVADAENPRAFVVDFDVAVAVSKTTDAEAKGAVSVYVFEVGGQRVSSTEQSP